MPVSYYGQSYPTLNKPEPPYTRPSDWLPLPTLFEGEEKLVGLFAVFDDDSNFLALYFEGDYTVDWGDGVIEDFSSGVTAEHTYSFASIDPATLLPRGCKQVVVTVTPQEGQSLSYMDLSVSHTSLFNTDVSYPWLDLSVSLPNAGSGPSIVFCGYTTGTFNFLGSVESISILSTGGCESLYECFWSCTSLEQLVIKEMPQVADVDYMFDSCTSLSVIVLPSLPQSSYEILSSLGTVEYLYIKDASSVDYLGEALSGAYAIRSLVIGKVGASLNNFGSDLYIDSLESVVIEDASLLEDAESAFYELYSLKQVSFPPTPALTYGYEMFAYCYNLEGVQFTEVSSLEDMTYMFYECYTLRNFYSPPTPALTSLLDTFESCYSLEEVVFQDLSALETLEYAFFDCPGLRSVTLPSVPSGASMYECFYGCFSIGYAYLSLSPGDMSYAFQDCATLQYAEIQDASQAYLVTDAFEGAFLLASLRVPGLTNNLILDGCNLSRDAIVQVFQDLGAVSPGTRSISVAGNWGASSLTPEDLQIATDKGWLVNTGSCDYPPFSCNTSVNPYCVTYLNNAWANCASITSFPALNVSNGYTFYRAWYNCSNMVSFDTIITGSGVSFLEAWYNCSSLTSFPVIDTALGAEFAGAWYNCSSLTSFPPLNFTSATSFGYSGYKGAWENCTSLVTFPPNLFDTCTATYFYKAWFNCALNQTSVDNILVSIDAAGTYYGVLNIDGGTSSPPGPAGLVAVVSLQSKGWTVVTN